MAMTVGEAALELKKSYERGKRRGQTALHIHLFGIKYADDLRSLSIREVVNRAGIPDYAAEINKGRNLAKYVQIREGCESWL